MQTAVSSRMATTSATRGSGPPRWMCTASPMAAIDPGDLEVEADDPHDPAGAAGGGRGDTGGDGGGGGGEAHGANASWTRTRAARSEASMQPSPTSTTQPPRSTDGSATTVQLPGPQPARRGRRAWRGRPGGGGRRPLGPLDQAQGTSERVSARVLGELELPPDHRLGEVEGPGHERVLQVSDALVVAGAQLAGCGLEGGDRRRHRGLLLGSVPRRLRGHGCLGGGGAGVVAGGVALRPAVLVALGECLGEPRCGSTTRRAAGSSASRSGAAGRGADRRVAHDGTAPGDDVRRRTHRHPSTARSGRTPRGRG